MNSTFIHHIDWRSPVKYEIVSLFPNEDYKLVDFVMVDIKDCTSATLIGKAVGYSGNA